MAGTVEVLGLAELRAGLAQAVTRLPGAIRGADKKAADLVVERARGIGEGLGSVAAKAARSIAVMAGEGAAEVVLDEPFGWGAEKGAVQFHQFKSFVGSDEDAGYFLGPAVKDSETGIEELYGQALDETLRPAFPS